MTEELKVIISAEISKLTQAMDGAKSAVNNFKQQVADASKDVDAKIAKLGTAIKNGMAVAAKAIAAAGAAMLALVPATKEYRENQAKLNAAFDQAGLSANSAKGVYSELYKVIGEHDQVTEAAQQIALLATSEQDAAKWAEVASGVVATFGDALQPEAFYEAANETLKLGEATGAYTQMLEQAGINVEDFNKRLSECETEAEKSAYMLEVTAQATAAAGEAYDEATAKIQAQNEANLRLQSGLAKVGDALSPVVTAFTNFGADALAIVAPYIEDMANNLLPTLTSALQTALGIIEGVTSSIAEHPAIYGAIAVALGIIVGAIGLYNAVAAVKAAMAAMEVTTVWALVSAYAAQAAAMIVAIAPYALIVAAIAAVVAAIYLLVKNWDEVVKHTKEAWNFIKQYVKEGVENAKQKFTEMKEAVINKATEIAQGARNKFTEVKTNISNAISDAKSKAIEGFNTMKSNISSKVSGIVSDVGAKFSSIKSSITEKIEAARSAVKTAIDKIKSIMNFSWSLPSLKMPSIKISGKFSLNPPSAPKFSISWNKLGGVFDKPTLFNYGGSLQGIGEDGAEAVVPLEKNTQWLDKIAERLQGRQTPIVIEVDGKVFAETAINTINANTKQTGRLNLIYT